MVKTRKKRKGPSESATLFSLGTKKKGNDGNMWEIIKTKNGVKRWKKISGKKKTRNKTRNKTRKKTRKKTKNKITVKIIKELKKKYNVTTTGNKKEMAEGLWTVHGRSMDNDDLEKILPLLSKKDKKDVEKLLSKRGNNPITNYKGMWKPLPKPLRKMTRNELIKHLRSFRNAWEKVTRRNQDLHDMRLKEETDEDLRGLLEFYFSDGAKQIAGDWLRTN